jgi:hypothetical protein
LHRNELKREYKTKKKVKTGHTGSRSWLRGTKLRGSGLALLNQPFEESRAAEVEKKVFLKALFERRAT